MAVPMSESVLFAHVVEMTVDGTTGFPDTRLKDPLPFLGTVLLLMRFFAYTKQALSL